MSPRPPQARRRTANLYDRAALGVYHGPPRTTAEPKLTPYRRRILQAIADKAIHRGKGQYERAWRWNDGGVVVTCTKWVDEALHCGWATVVGAHPVLTETGAAALDGGGS